MSYDSAAISVIIPCRNEGRYIITVLQRLMEQDYSNPFEIIVVDAMSTDDTIEQIEKFIREKNAKQIRVLSNEKIIIPSGLNKGILNAKGDIIIRMDGHALPQKDYVRIAVDIINKYNYDVVGGICKSVPARQGCMAKGISIGISYIFGVGDSRFRLTNSKQKDCFVDTVPFGCFKKSLWEKLGGYDETLLTNEDYDFNYRVRKNGGTVFLTPLLVTDYFARGTISELAKQYFRYGRWKLKMLLKQPKSLRLRHLIPPVFLFFLATSGLLSFLSSFFLCIFLILLSSYVLANIVAAIHASITAGIIHLFPYLMVVFFVMHFSWGGGLWYSLLEQFRDNGKLIY